MFTHDCNTLNKNDSVKQLVLDEQALFMWVHKQDTRIWELVKVIWICSYGFICVAYKSKSVLQMACQEKDTESLKSLQTELWWAFKNLKFPSCDLDRASFLSLLNLKFPYCLCVSFPSQAISDCWAESSSPPGGSGAHHTVWTRHLVLSSFYLLPLGTILYLMEHSCFWLGLL